MVDMNNLKDKALKGTEKVAEAMGVDILIPVPARVRKRLAEIKKMSSAKTIKIMRGHIKTFQTTPPKVHIAKLEHSLVNGVGTISYQLYKMDGHNKAVHEEKEEIINSAGDKVERLVNVNYIIDKSVVETIEYHKAIKVQEFKEELIL